MHSATRSLRRPRALMSAALIASLAATLSVAEFAEAREPPPSFVVIVTDDQAPSMMDGRALPNTFAQLVAKGTTFTDSIVTTPLCCPSRASLLTGQYGHNNGVLRNNYGNLLSKRNTLPAWLGAAGYRTAHVGRYLNAYEDKAKRPEDVAPGWDNWQTQLEPRQFYDYELSVNGKRRHFGGAERNYFTRVVNRKSARIAKRLARRAEPFYLQIDHLAPHKGGGDSAQACPNAPLPDPRDIGAFAGEPLPSPASLNEADVSDKPTFIQDLPEIAGSKLERLAEQYQCGLESLLAVDRGVGRLVNAIDEVDELSRTVFVFTSDHGYFFGEHRITDSKHFAYEEGLKVPLVIRLPKRYRRGAERIPKVDLPVANIDLAPTIVRLARGEPCRRPGKCRTMDGRSLLSLLREPDPVWPTDRALAVEIGLPASSSPPIYSYQAVRTPTQFYIQHESIESPATGECVPASEIEHYGLLSDPFELDNLYPGAPGSSLEALQGQLALRVASLRDCAGIEGRDPLPTSGQFCE